MTTKLTQEQLFLKVARHMLKQQQKSFNYDDGECRYRSGELSCAVGCLITDAAYDENIEGYSVGEPPVMRALDKSLGYHLNQLEIAMLKNLQIAHDRVDVDRWEEHLAVLAEKHFAWHEAQFLEKVNA